MAEVPEGLHNHLLFTTACTHQKGLSAQHFVELVVEFHRNLEANQDDTGEAGLAIQADIFLSTKPPVDTRRIDSAYLDTIWKALFDHSDLDVRIDPSSDSNVDTVPDATILPEQSDFVRTHSQHYLIANEERQWQELTGHAKDRKKIAGLEWECLIHIAESGRAGILQPKLRQITGQDKRSIPKRTDSLASKGYIIKTQCLTDGMMTSLCQLKQFADNVEIASSGDAQSETNYYDTWWHSLLKCLRSNDNLVAVDDIKRQLDIQEKTIALRRFQRALRRIIATGLVCRVKAGNGSRRAKTNCVKLLREPSDVDYKKFAATFINLRKQSVGIKDEADVKDEDDEDDYDNEDETTIVETRPIECHEGSADHIDPIWTPDVHYSSTVFEAVNASGSKGIVSMELNSMLYGPLFRRPFDEALAKLTDFWQVSQPAHLRHLAIVRDTRSMGTIPQYLYRSFTNFNKAVRKGEASWDYVLNQSFKDAASALRRAPDLDEWGFSRVDPRAFSGDGTVPMSRCGRATVHSDLRVKPKLGRPLKHRSHDDLDRSADSDRPSKKSRPRSTSTSRKHARLNETDDVFEIDGRPKSLITSHANNHSDFARKRVERERTEWDARCRRRAEALVRQEASTVERSSSMLDTSLLGSQTVDSNGTDTKKQRKAKKRKRETAGSSTVSTTRMDSARVDAVATELDSRSTPGVFINPPGSIMLKMREAPSRGRPRNALIAVFKLDQLANLDWFSNDVRNPSIVVDDAATRETSIQRLAKRQKPSKSNGVGPAPEAETPSQVDQHSLDSISRRPVKSIVERREPTTLHDESTQAAPGRERQAKGVPASLVKSAQRHSKGATDDATGVATSTSSRLQTKPRGSSGQTTATERDLIMSTFQAPAAKALHPTRASVQSEHAESVRSRRGDVKVGLRTTGGMAKHRRQQVIVDIIKKCGGMFPGENEMHYIFLSEMERLYNSKPDRITMLRDINELIETGKLQRIKYHITNRAGAEVERRIIMLITVDPAGNAVRELQTQVAAVYPRIYVPPTAPLAKKYRIRQSIGLESAMPKNPVPEEETPVKRLFAEEASKYSASFNERLRKEIQKRKERQQAEDEAQERYVTAANDIEAGAAALCMHSRLPAAKRAAGRGRQMARLRFGDDQMSTGPRRALGSLKSLRDKISNPLAKPTSLQSILEQAPTPRKRKSAVENPEDAEVQFDHEVRQVAAWEKKQHQQQQQQDFQSDGNSGPMAFINHTLPSNFEQIAVQPLQWLRDGDVPEQRTEPILKASERPSRPLMAHNTRPRQTSIVSADSERSTSTPARPRGRPRKQPEALFTEAEAALLGPRRQFERRIVGKNEFPVSNLSAGIPRAEDMDAPEQHRLILAVAVVITLTGGLDLASNMSINWVAVSQAFHFKYTYKDLRSHWNTFRLSKGVPKVSPQLRNAFRESYLLALKARDIPDIDLDNVSRVDWAELVDWADERIKSDNITSPKTQIIDLPSTRDRLELRSQVHEKEQGKLVDTDHYYTLTTSIARRDELVEALTYAMPIRNKISQQDDDGTSTLAQSWIRATACTPDEGFDAQQAHDKLDKCGERMLGKAQEDLEAQKIIRQRHRGQTLPGRNYVAHDDFKRAFKRIWDAELFSEAFQHKLRLDEQFTKTSKPNDLSFHAPDAHHMIALNLTASGMTTIKAILPPINHSFESTGPRSSKWGFTDANYKTVHMDRSRLQFSLELAPTIKYKTGPLSDGISPPPLSLQNESETRLGARLPYWTSINGKLVCSMWTQILMSVLYFLAMRPGMTVEAMIAAHKGKLWDWELELLLNWAEESGVARRVTQGDGSGWTAAPGWLMALPGTT